MIQSAAGLERFLGEYRYAFYHLFKSRVWDYEQPYFPT